MKKLLIGLVCLMLAGVGQVETGQADETGQTSVTHDSPCQSAEHRGFDFWLGEWRVSSPGREGWLARSSITLGNDGCSVHEAYTAPGGYQGTSVNLFDSARQLWHQTWIDNQGRPLYLEGGIKGRSMVLTDGRNQITWTPLEDGRIRQHWEITQDAGKTFKSAFDGYYERLAE
tara:strand:- start:949 stop:1467 length:519 start_codon:yes stop_codon:yes gene_type:complete